MIGVLVGHTHFDHAIDVLRARFQTLRDFSTRGRVYFADPVVMDPASAEKLNVPVERLRMK